MTTAICFGKAFFRGISPTVEYSQIVCGIGFQPVVDSGAVLPATPVLLELFSVEELGARGLPDDRKNLLYAHAEHK